MYQILAPILLQFYRSIIKLGQVRSHIFLCVLAHYVEWHLRKAWQSQLFEHEYLSELEAGSPVLPVLRSASALKKASAKTFSDHAYVHSLQTPMAELTTRVSRLCDNRLTDQLPVFGQQCQ